MSPRNASLSVSAAREWRRRWDRQQERLVPHREQRFRAIVGTLGAVLGNRFRVLDVGCGTGSLSERILTRFPHARGVALDVDPVTLTIGRRGLGEMAGRLQWVEADLRDPRWHRALPPGRWDAVVSSTALHWLTDRELGRVYRTLAGVVRRGGLFLNGDWIAFGPGSPRFAALARRAGRRAMPPSGDRGEGWKEWWEAALRDPTLASEAHLHRIRFPRGHPPTATPDLPGHVRLLRRAGFREVEVVWSWWQDRVVAALR